MLGLGTAALEGDGNNDGTLSNIVCAAVSEGVRLYDTAQNYGSETGLGEGLKMGMLQHRVPREDIYISGKVDLNSLEDPNLRMRRQVESSLKHLQTTYMDSMILHWPICLDKHGKPV
jgi:diketogulonate reductase-like aldo/keto reductase